ALGQARQDALAVAKCRLPPALPRHAATHEIDTEEEIVLCVACLACTFLPHSAERAREDAGAGHEAAGDARRHGGIMKGFDRQEATLAQGAKDPVALRDGDVGYRETEGSCRPSWWGHGPGAPKRWP